MDLKKWKLQLELVSYLKACIHLHGLLRSRDRAWSASGLVDHAQSKFCTLAAQSMCADIDRGLQQSSVFCSVYCKSCALKGFFLIYSVCSQNKKLVLFEAPLIFQKKLFFPRKRQNRFCLKLAFFQSSFCGKFEVRLGWQL